MDARWFLSQFYAEETGGTTHLPVPICSAYGAHWFCPTAPADLENGWALVLMLSDPHQLEAAAADPRVIVCPLLFDPTPLPAAVTEAYTSWGATPGMSLAALLAKLHSTEPAFGRSLSY